MAVDTAAVAITAAAVAIMAAAVAIMAAALITVLDTRPAWPRTGRHRLIPAEPVAPQGPVTPSRAGLARALVAQEFPGHRDRGN